MKTRNAALTLLISLALATTAGTASAQDSKRNYGPGTLTPEQVKGCVRDRNGVVALNLSLSQEKNRLTAEAEEIAAVEAGLVYQQTEMSRSREELVGLKAATHTNDLEAHLKATTEFRQKSASFNALVRTYNEGVTRQQARRETHNAAVLKLNAQLEQLRERANAVDYRCTGAKAYQEDVRAAKEALSAEQPGPQATPAP